jgi:hypothetical protein
MAVMQIEGLASQICMLSRTDYRSEDLSMPVEGMNTEGKKELADSERNFAAQKQWDSILACCGKQREIIKAEVYGGAQCRSGPGPGIWNEKCDPAHPSECSTRPSICDTRKPVWRI